MVESFSEFLRSGAGSLNEKKSVLQEFKNYDEWLDRKDKSINGYKKGNTSAKNAKLINCVGCWNCVDCKDCDNCEDSIGCSGCTDCSGCVDCSKCIGCHNCTNLKGRSNMFNS